MSTFPTAAEARAGSRNNLTIHAEIRSIEQLIYTAISDGSLSVRITTSPMTNPLALGSNAYYKVLFEDFNDRSLKEQIDIVRKNFVDLGYQVTPLKNTSTGNTFLWEILW